MSNTKLMNLINKNEISVYDARDLINAIAEKCDYGLLASAGETMKRDMQDAMDVAKTIGSTMNAIYERATNEFEQSEPAYSEMYERTKNTKLKVNEMCKEIRESNDALDRETRRTRDLVEKFRYITDADLNHLCDIASQIKKLEAKK